MSSGRSGEARSPAPTSPFPTGSWGPLATEEGPLLMSAESPSPPGIMPTLETKQTTGHSGSPEGGGGRGKGSSRAYGPRSPRSPRRRSAGRGEQQEGALGGRQGRGEGTSSQGRRPAGARPVPAFLREAGLLTPSLREGVGDRKVTGGGSTPQRAPPGIFRPPSPHPCLGSLPAPLSWGLRLYCPSPVTNHLLLQNPVEPHFPRGPVRGARAPGDREPDPRAVRAGDRVCLPTEQGELGLSRRTFRGRGSSRPSLPSPAG